MKDLIEALSKFAGDALGDDAEKYQDPLVQGIEALAAAKVFLEHLQSGDKIAAQTVLTEFEDVNRTLEAIGKMDQAIQDAEDGIKLNDVLDVVGKVMKVVTTIGMAAL